MIKFKLLFNESTSLNKSHLKYSKYLWIKCPALIYNILNDREITPTFGKQFEHIIMFSV